jgi:hypothetical protein
LPSCDLSFLLAELGKTALNSLPNSSRRRPFIRRDRGVRAALDDASLNCAALGWRQPV